MPLPKNSSRRAFASGGAVARLAGGVRRCCLLLPLLGILMGVRGAVGLGNGVALARSAPQEAPGDTEPVAAARPATHEPGELLVKVRAGGAALQSLESGGSVPERGARRLTAALEGGMGVELEELGLRAVVPVFRVADVPAEARRAPALTGRGAPELATARQALFRWYRVELADDASAEEAMRRLQGSPEIEAVERNGHYRLAGVPSASTDPRFKDQWHFVPAKIPETWQYLVDHGLPPGGSRDVVVAVVDSGVDYTHEDLRGNMWVNGGEIRGNGIDDDGNGFVDDVHGCSTTYEPHEHSGDPMDLLGHGTHVAGIVAAVANNQLGGAGVAFNAQVMAVRVGQENGTLAFDDAAEGILYATDHGADVINMSWGGFYPSLLIQDALAVAFSQAVLVAAAGNDYGRTADVNPHYPAAYPWVLGVVATGRDGKLADFSNYDRYPGTRFEYEVAAPGVDILSTLPGNRYAAWNGTSMATPIVAGAAALLRSVFADRSVYSSRYIMGQITMTAETPNPPAEKEARVVNPPKAIVTIAKPSVRALEDWALDRESFGPRNNGDGGIDSGETIQLAFEVINLSGVARGVEGRLASVDRYVTIRTASATFGDLGPMNTGNNGFVYDTGGTLVEVSRPFVIEVAPDCPNGHFVQIEFEITCRNGLDLNDGAIYSSKYLLQYLVQRGSSLPRIIDQDLVLDSSRFWIVKGPVLVEPWATLTVLSGTRIQWGGLSDDAYSPGPMEGRLVVRGTLRVQGSAAAPVEFFPSDVVPGQQTVFDLQAGCRADLAYARIRNPVFTGPADRIDHCYFDWQYGDCVIRADEIGHTVFHRLRGREPVRADWFHGCLFDAGSVPPASGAQLHYSVFLPEATTGQGLRLELPVSVNGTVITNQTTYAGTPVYTNGVTYLPVTFGHGSVLNLYMAEALAQRMGGHVTSVADASEQAILESLGSGVAVTVLGMDLRDYPRRWVWLDGSPVTYTHWLGPAQGAQWAAHPAAHRGPRQVCAMNFNYWTHEMPVRHFWQNLPEWPPYSQGQRVIFKLPGEVPSEALAAALQGPSAVEFLRRHHPGYIRNNAFLNRYWDLNVQRWMRFYAPEVGAGGGPGTFATLRDNFWGTKATNLIEHAIVDYRDTFTTSVVDYEPVSEGGHPGTYPFVVDVLVNGTHANTAPVLGSGPAVFRVVFNRDMNTAAHPFVTFGPAEPYTDFVVPPDGAGWVDARTWQGRFNINPMTGEGYHLMRISGAVAADDPWLVSGYDVGRFRFQVQTLGVRALTLQATGGEGAVHLSWQQDDFDLLAGYHLYRSATSEGPYARLNRSLILPGEEAYVDTDVTPAVPMFYRFTVVTTGLTESDYSNVASAAALDTIPPVLEHAAVTGAVAGRGLRLVARATDNVGVRQVTLWHRRAGSGGAFQAVEMVNTDGDDWSATLPGSLIVAPGIEYYLEASDGFSAVYHGTAATPNTVVVVNQPAVTSVSPDHGPAGGGTTVSLSGVLFQTGAGVQFGDAMATEVRVLSESQITCRTPAHFPAVVDVKVVNPAGPAATLLNGFRFEAGGVVVSLPDVGADYGSEFEVPLSVAGVTGLRAAGVVISFDPGVLSLLEARAGALVAGWTVSANTGQAGRASLSFASPTAVTGSGPLAVLRFRVLAPPPASTALAIESVVLNDGAIAVERDPGRLTVNAFAALSGRVTSAAGTAVRNVTLSLTGVGTRTTTTAADGGFVFADLPTGAYILVPAKADDVAGIGALDAALILQQESGLATLSEVQRVAADVNRNGLITAMDASYVLEYAVGLRGLPFPGAGRVWSFLPETRQVPLLNQDLAGQDFVAVLLGEVSGNWVSPAVHLAGWRGGSGAPGLHGGDPAGWLVAVAPGLPTDRQSRRLVLRGDAVIHAMELDLVVSGVDARELLLELGDLGAGMLWASHAPDAGHLRVAMAGARGLAGEGVLAVFRLPEGRGFELGIEAVRIDEGAVAADVAVSARPFDTDGDGLLNSEESGVFGTDPLRADTDGDGHTDAQEVAAGTNPLLASSRLALSVVAPDGAGGWVLRWGAAPGRRYTVQFTDALPAREWRTLLTTGPAAGGEVTARDPGTPSGAGRYYRLRLED